MNKDFKKIKIKKLLENDEEQIKLKREINPILPRIDKHQVMLVLGGINTGKSSLVANLIFSNEIYGYNGNVMGTGTNNNHSKISELITKTRHFQLSIILIGQSINQAFSSTIKANTRQIFLKKMRNTKELKKFIEQYADMFGGEEAFLKQYDYTFKGENTKFNFMYCNLDDLFVMKNFDELMYYNEELLI